MFISLNALAKMKYVGRANMTKTHSIIIRTKTHGIIIQIHWYFCVVALARSSKIAFDLASAFLIFWADAPAALAACRLFSGPSKSSMSSVRESFAMLVFALCCKTRLLETIVFKNLVPNVLLQLSQRVRVKFTKMLLPVFELAKWAQKLLRWVNNCRKTKFG